MEYLYVILVLLGIYVILASSFNLVIGYGGLISVAHPAFFALGAYASGLLAKDVGLPIPLAIMCGASAAFLCSILVSLPALRVSGDYLMIASIGFQLGLIELIKNIGFTGGTGGLSGIPPFLVREFGSGAYALFTWLSAGAVILIIRHLVRSDYGRAMSALRDDEIAFASLGRNAVWIKVWVIALGSGMAGFAGALYAHFFRFVTPEQFDVLQSAAMLTMIVVGGMKTIWGPVIGAILLQILPQAITFLNLPPNVLGPLQGLLFTGLVLVFMFFRPQGLVPAEEIWRGGRRPAAPDPGRSHVGGT